MKINKNPKKKLLIITLLAVAALACTVAFLSMRDGFDKGRSANEVDQSAGINLDPPTDEEKQRADDNKRRIEERERAIEDAQNNDDGPRRTVTPAFSYLGQYGAQIEIGSYVSGIYEDGGTCTAKFSKDGESFSRSVQANKNVTSVDCSVIAVPVSDFPSKGIWSVVVSYDSLTAAGSSETRTFEVK